MQGYCWDAGDPTMSFPSYPARTDKIDSKKTVFKSQHIFFIHLYAHNLQVVSPNALYL